MTNFNWTCPYCNRESTITNSNFSSEAHYFNLDNKEGDLVLITTVITCPNKGCIEYSIRAKLYPVEKFGTIYQDIEFQKLRMEWQMKPISLAKQYPV